MTKLHTGIISVLAAAAVTLPLAVQHHARVQLRQRDEALRQQSEQLSQLNAETERLSNQLASAKSAQGLSKSELNDLLRLRAQVGDLKKQLASAQAQAARLAAAPVNQSPQPSGSSPDQGNDAQKQLAIAKMTDVKHWLLAFRIYADSNQGQLPPDFDHAASYIAGNTGISQEQRDEVLRATNQFEILYNGPLNALTNPSQTIVIREIEPTPGSGGGWRKTYGFADGPCRNTPVCGQQLSGLGNATHRSAVELILERRAPARLEQMLEDK